MDVGEYKILVSVDADGDCNGDSDEKTFTIHRRDIADAQVQLGDALSYTMEEQTQEILSVMIGSLPVTYTVTGNTEINTGTYEMILTGTGNFTGQKKVTYSIGKMESDAKQTMETSTSIRLNNGLKMKQSVKAIQLQWDTIAGATSYDLYVQYCGKKMTERNRITVEGDQVTKVTLKKINGKKIDPTRNYKIYVIAWKSVAGQKVKLGKSLTFHVAGKKNAAVSNIKAIRLKKKNYSLKVGGTAKIKATAVPEKPSGKQFTDKHIKTLRYVSSDTKVAKVSASGTIKAVGQGACKIYVYSYNGCKKKIQVKVK